MGIWSDYYRKEEKMRDEIPDNWDEFMLYDEIEKRERDYPPAPQCKACKKGCKVHLPPGAVFVCLVEEKRLCLL